MIHHGDITRISGTCVPPVDVIIGGSPCQDLSIAGKREGLAGTESRLFLEQIRLIKEMRNADIQRGRTGQLIRPRYMVWENVPGAFSSNKGEDFRVVLQETIRIAEPDAPDIPLPPKGRWQMADAWYGDGWSVAYRVLDAQFWGVPQRRRRIALVADFGGHAAIEILFVRKGVCGDIAEGEAQRKRTRAGIKIGPGDAVAIRERAGRAGGGGKGPLIQVERAGTLSCNNDQTIFCLNDQGGSIMETSVDVTGSLRAQEHGHQPIVAFAQNQLGEVRTGTVAGTLNTNSNASGRNAPLIYDARGNGDGKTSCTLTGDYEDRVTDYTAIVMATGQGGTTIMENTAPTLACNREQPVVTFAERPEAKGCLTPWDIQSHRVYPDSGIYSTLYAHESGGGTQGCIQVHTGVLRRLTPLECERLQGYPDGWTDIGPWVDGAGKRHKKSSDTARYKALGNSIALPPWAWVLKRLCACYERPATMASLFDGIGGFPLLWEQLNGPGSCLWASEIEEFPMAVTKRRFGGERQ